MAGRRRRKTCSTALDVMGPTYLPNSIGRAPLPAARALRSLFLTPTPQRAEDGGIGWCSISLPRFQDCLPVPAIKVHELCRLAACNARMTMESLDTAAHVLHPGQLIDTGSGFTHLTSKNY